MNLEDLILNVFSILSVNFIFFFSIFVNVNVRVIDLIITVPRGHRRSQELACV